MNKLLLILTLSLGIFQSLMAQKGQFYVEVSSDTVILDNFFEVSFVIENLDGEFEAPDFADFQVLSGPNTSMSMSIINNKMTRSSKYSFMLKPRDTGRFFIEPAYLISDEGNHETEPIEIIVNNTSDLHPNTSKKNKKSSIKTNPSEPKEDQKSKKRERKKL